MYSNYPGSNYNYYDRPGLYSKQTQLIDEKQAMEQAVSHDILFQLLSTAEAYALGPNGPRQFKGYELCNSSLKTRAKLREQLLIHTDTFKHSYRFFKNDHMEYNFPENLGIPLLIQLFTSWKAKVDYRDQEIYDRTINLLKGLKLGKANFRPSDFAENENISDVQMGNIMNNMVKINYSNERLGENAIVNAKLNSGKYVGRAEFNANRPVDPYLREIHGNVNEPIAGYNYQKRLPDDKKLNYYQ